LPTPGNCFFGWAGGGTPAGTGVISYRLRPATYLSPPLDDLRYQTSAVPEAPGWALMALGLLGLALGRYHLVQPGEIA
jgi:hypothetical protein